MDHLVFISTAELQDLINSNGVDIIDTGMDHKQAYLNSHIPNAVYFNVTEIKSKTSNLSVGFPTLDEFREYMAVLGIKNNKKVKVVYDRNMILSGRAWYLLKHFGVADVRILNGGLAKWVAEGRPTENEVKQELKKAEEIKDPKVPEPEKIKDHEKKIEAVKHQEPKGHEAIKDHEKDKQVEENKEPNKTESKENAADEYSEECDFNFTEDNNYIVLYSDVKQISEEIRSGQTDVKIWDPRPKDAFEAGTVDSAINVPWVEFMNPDNTVKSPEEVREIFDKRLGGGPIIVSCMKGIAASFGLALLAYSGYKERRLYAGSYEEWSKMKASST